MNFYKILLLLGLSFFMFHCTSTSTEEEEMEDMMAGDDDNEDAVTYTADVKTIFDTNCAVSGCHVSPNPRAGLLLSTYDAVVDGVQNRGLITRINNASNPMPASGLLDQELRSLIDQWVADGLIQ